MTKEEIINRIDTAISEMQALKNEVQNIPEENDDNSVPETLEFLLNEPFYYVDRDGNIASNSYRDNATERNIRRHRRLFKAYDYAEEFQRKTQFIADLLHFKWLYDRDFVPDWKSDRQNKYYVYYSHGDNLYRASLAWGAENENVCFSTVEIAKKCADWLNSRKEKNEQ